VVAACNRMPQGGEIKEGMIIKAIYEKLHPELWHAGRFAAGPLGGYDSELPDHCPAGPPVTSILHEEKAFTALRMTRMPKPASSRRK
jgi:hypothetical protein